jgi:hypothetical protein
MSFREVTLWFYGLLLLIALFGRLEHLICETQESIAVLGLVLSLVVEDANAIQEAFKFTRPGSVLLIASWPLYVVHGAMRFTLLVVVLGRATLVRVA